MQRHTRLTNALPVEGPIAVAGASLDPQQCFDKAMENVATLKAGPENKKYSVSKLQRLRAACSLAVGQMSTNLPPFHDRLLAEGCLLKC
jgi:hypothetical protein